MKRLIINADDYNLTVGCNQAIEALMDAGIVTSASCIVGDGSHIRGPLKRPMGVHLLGSNSSGWEGQVRRFLAAGGILTHIDSHHHYHGLERLHVAYAKLCAEFRCAGVPLSVGQRQMLVDNGVRCADHVETRWTDGSLNTLVALLAEDFRVHNTVHLMCHPGILDQELRKHSTMTSVRALEYYVLSSGQFRDWLQGQKIILRTYSDIEHYDPLDKVDLIFLAWNRFKFTAASLKALLANTEWSMVRRVVVYDDGSTDGSRSLLTAFGEECPVDGRRVNTQHLGPVGIMNDYITHQNPAEWFCKIDNDVIVPRGWLPTSINALRANPAVDLLGIEAKCALPKHQPFEYDQGVEPCGHIGGIGLMRTAAFLRNGLPEANGRLGFSAWQIQHDVGKAWLNPSLPVILLDRLPMEPWAGLSAQYEALGWQRPWQRYTDADAALWEWWQP